jgi:uncharacterized protein (DUF486 family)
LGIVAGMIPKWLIAVLLLVGSNVFMTYAWYYHVKAKTWPLVTAIVVSWLIAGVEYCLQVPANRMGHVNFGGPFTAPQLKIIQEAITLVVFAVFSLAVLHERLRTTDIVAFVLIFAGVLVSTMGPAWMPWLNGAELNGAGK